MGGVGPTSGAAGSTIGRGPKLANAKSKMKMIDVTEVQGLNIEHKQREDKMAKEESREQKLLARKRKIMESAAEKGLVALPKIRELEEEIAKEHKPMPPAPPAAAGTAEQATASGNGAGSSTAGDAAPPSSDTNVDWQLILKERSNKLSPEDRIRVEQFFTNRFNPTPDQLIYKMKLHEERTTDVKETYYLELDYGTFTFKQSKKTKRYWEK